MRLWTYSLRESQRRPGRALFTVMAVAIGTSFLSATALTSQTARRAYRDLFECLSGPAALEAVGAGQGGFDPTCAAGFARVSGVKAVLPRIQAMAALTGPPAAEPVLVLGFTRDSAAADSGCRLVEGRAAAENDEIALETGCIKARRLALGDHIRLWTPTGLAELRLTGAVEVGTGRGSKGVSVAVVSLNTAQRLFGLPGRINSVQILLHHSADAAAVQALLAAHLPPGVLIQSPGARADLAGATMAAARRGLEGLGIAAMLGAVFVVYNTFRLGVGERYPTLAALRTLGATRRQVVRLLLTEACALGAAGALLGAASGPVLAVFLSRALGAVDAWRSATHCCTTLICAALIGPAATTAAALPPAWSCANSDLLGELRAPRGGVESAPRFLPILGFVLLAASGVIWLGANEGVIPVAAARALLAPAVGALLLGGMLVGPRLVGLLLSLAERLFGLFLGVEFTLAVRQLRRRMARTGLTAGVLFIAAATAVGFGHWLRASLTDVQHWYARTIVADYLIRGAMPDAAFLTAAPLPDSLVGEIAGASGVAAVDRIAFVPARVNGRPALVLARTIAADRPLPLDLREGDTDAVRRGLLRGEVVVGTGLARALGAAPGGKVTLETGDGPRTLRIAGTAAEYADGGQALYLEWGAAQRLLGVSGPHVLLVTARRGGPSPVDALQNFCEKRRLLLQSNAEVREVIDQMLRRLANALWVVVVVAFLVAGLGVANTLALNVQEQRRELALLRVVGLRRSQVRRVILWQALLMGLSGLAPGALAGLGLGGLLCSSADTATRLVCPIDWLLIVLCMTAGLVCCLFAALIPTRPYYAESVG